MAGDLFLRFNKFIDRLEGRSGQSYISLSIICVLCSIPIVILLLQTFLTHRLQSPSPRGCRKLGLTGPSNIADEYKAQSETVHAGWKVKSLWIYPVKSCRGIELDTSAVVSTGLEHDRLFSFAQLKSPFPVSLHTPDAEKAAHKWEFVTIRQYRLLALVKTELWLPDPSIPGYDPSLPEVQSGGVLILTFPHPTPSFRDRTLAFLTRRAPEASFRVPFDPSPAQVARAAYPLEPITIWKDSPLALNMSAHLPPTFAYHLGVTHPLALFRASPAHLREVYRCAPRAAALGYQPVTAFADAYPLHLMNLGSVQDVGRRIAAEVPRLSVMRFRPNIVVSGMAAYEEDGWKRVRLGEGVYYVSCRTARCWVPNTDPDTAVKHRVEPFRVLQTYRRIDEGAGKHHCLGMQMVPSGKGVVRVGDQVEVLERGEHFYIVQ